MKWISQTWKQVKYHDNLITSYFLTYNTLYVKYNENLVTSYFLTTPCMRDRIKIPTLLFGKLTMFTLNTLINHL